MRENVFDEAAETLASPSCPSQLMQLTHSHGTCPAIQQEMLLQCGREGEGALLVIIKLVAFNLLNLSFVSKNMYNSMFSYLLYIIQLSPRCFYLQ